VRTRLLVAVEPNTREALHDVFVNAEGLIFRRGRIYPESFALPQYAKEYRRASVYGRFLLKNHWLRRRAVRIPSALWVIDNVSNNYFHWMVESLPRLLRAETCRPDQHVLLLPHHYRRLAFVPFTLRAFPQIARIEWIDARSKARVEHLAFIARLPRQRPERLPDPDELAEVVRRVASLAGDKAAARRIYFSRADASRRRARNEEDVVRVLRAHDFEIIRSDPTKPWEQVRASLGAGLMVGVHGAALTNLMFMEKGARLLELRHPNHWNIYGTLAEMFGVEYSSQICHPADTASGRELRHDDLIVDLDQLRENQRD
jgi:capsular polysaccharide biosynthesis protein